MLSVIAPALSPLPRLSLAINGTGRVGQAPRCAQQQQSREPSAPRGAATFHQPGWAPYR